MSRSEIIIEGGTEIGYHVYIDDGWYGKRYFYFLKVGDIGKTEARKKYQSMVRKYILQILKVKGGVGKIEILKNGDTQTTYIHTIGPCYSLDRVEINNKEFKEFAEIENERLEHNRENRLHRLNFEDFKSYKMYGY